ncbi:MAG: hypothetical protein M1834_007155 [Cirrosporium novae-zelandiae]|nr:MAG: hypothetical protein M1834_007155 [Cirrosporium novae-zelandiae]
MLSPMAPLQAPLRRECSCCGLPAQTSIWRGVDDDRSFYKVVDSLERQNRHLAPEKTFHHWEWKRRGNHDYSGERTLSFSLERRLATDLAFLLAVSTHAGVENMAAVAIEERSSEKTLVVKAASNARFKEHVEETMRKIIAQLEIALRPDSEPLQCANQIFPLVIDLHYERILWRLGTAKGNGPLHPSLRRQPFISRLWEYVRKTCKQHEEEHCDTYFHLESHTLDIYNSFVKLRSPKDLEEERMFLDQLLRQAHAATSCMGRRTLSEALIEKGDMDESVPERSVRELEKLSRYLGVCIDLCQGLKLLPRHQFSRVRLQLHLPQSERLRGKDRLVHAEMELFAELELHPPDLRPRVIGTSKASCFLCEMFMRYQGVYYLQSSHGRLYSQWAVPDYEGYSFSSRIVIRAALRKMKSTLLSIQESTPRLPTFIPFDIKSFIADPSMESLLFKPNDDGYKSMVSSTPSKVPESPEASTSSKGSVPSKASTHSSTAAIRLNLQALSLSRTGSLRNAFRLSRKAT